MKDRIGVCFVGIAMNIVIKICVLSRQFVMLLTINFLKVRRKKELIHIFRPNKVICIVLAEYIGFESKKVFPGVRRFKAACVKVWEPK
eukprot:16458_1